MNPEHLVIGGCLLAPDMLPMVANLLTPEDFTHPAHAGAFRAMVTLKKTGEPVEPFTAHRLAVEQGTRGLNIAELYEWIGLVNSGASVMAYAKDVKENSTRRRLTQAGLAFQQATNDPTVPAAETVSSMLEALKQIRDQSTDTELHAKSLGQILDMPEVPEDWVIPNLFERGDRMIITGYEGLGKTTWIRQMGICASAGINPITLDHLPKPVRTLVVDVENSEKQWRRETHGMARFAANYGPASPRDNMHVYCGGRMDLRKDKDLGLVHRLVDEHQPEILFIGPIYRLVPNGINSDDDAAPLIAALDTLRDRGLVLVMEAHAPKGQPGERNLAPRGSAALMGWPEFGFGLAPKQDGSGADIVRWRADRDAKREWPVELDRWSQLPWVADTVGLQDRNSIANGRRKS